MKVGSYIPLRLRKPSLSQLRNLVYSTGGELTELRCILFVKII